MPIRRPDIYEHNNPKYAFADSDFIRGGFRTPVVDLAALYALSNHIDQLKEHATIVYVIEENNYYELIDSTQANNENGWGLFMDVGLPINGASNGLSIDNRNVVLGGDLSSNTLITTNNYGFCFSSDEANGYAKANVCLNTDYDNSSILICARDSGLGGCSWCSSIDSSKISLSHYNNSSNGSSISIYNTGITFYSKASNVTKITCLGINGMTYAKNYSNYFTNRSLVDKEYVDNKVSEQSNIVSVRIVGANDYTTILADDFVGISGASRIYLDGTPVIGQRVSIVDVCGDALLNNITVDGNGKKINDSTRSMINTNYGSITYVFNGYCWSATAFVN